MSIQPVTTLTEEEQAMKAVGERLRQSLAWISHLLECLRPQTWHERVLFSP